MASSSERQLKVKFVGETSGIKGAVSETEAALGRLGNTTRNLAAAFGLAFGATQVVGFLKDAAAAAAEDERAQRLLALAITDNTTATAEQIAQTERWITATQNATGVLDDQLRPALAMIVGATHDVGTAQEFMQTALDISAARGLDVETVANAITKAYNGQTAGLGRLGIQTKSMSGDMLDFTQIMENANATYGGAAAAAADTSAGRLAILNAKFTDMKEQIGNEVLPILIAFESFMLERIIPAIEQAKAVFIQLPGAMQTGTVVALNSILTMFTAAANTIIGAVNVALQKLASLPIFGVAGLGNILKYGGGVLGGIIGQGASKTQIEKINAPQIDVPYFPGSAVIMAGPQAGLIAGGAVYDPTAGAGALTPGNARGAIAGGGGGGGGGGGKSALEKKKEEDDRLIGEALKAWANYRDNMREIEDNMYDNEEISYEQYKDILEKRLATAVKGSDEWTSIQKRLADVSKQYNDKMVRDEQEKADALKKIQDQEIRDKQDALNKLMEIQDNQFEVGAISAEAYIAILEHRLQGMEQFTNEWTRTYEEIQRVAQQAGLAAPTLGQLGGGGYMAPGQQTLYGPGTATNSTVINIATITVPDPRGLVDTLQQIDRTYGGVPINVRTPA